MFAIILLSVGFEFLCVCVSTFHSIFVENYHTQKNRNQKKT